MNWSSARKLALMYVNMHVMLMLQHLKVTYYVKYLNVRCKVILNNLNIQHPGRVVKKRVFAEHA